MQAATAAREPGPENGGTAAALPPRRRQVDRIWTAAIGSRRAASFTKFAARKPTPKLSVRRAVCHCAQDPAIMESSA